MTTPCGKQVGKAVGRRVEELLRKAPAQRRSVEGDLYVRVMHDLEKSLFQTVMAHTDDNQSEAARILGIARGTLRTKLKTLGL